METLRFTLKNIRLSKNITLRQLGKASFLSHSFIADIESGRCSNPSVDTIMALAKALGVPPSALLDEEFENVAESKPIYNSKKSEAEKNPES